MKITVTIDLSYAEVKLPGEYVEEHDVNTENETDLANAAENYVADELESAFDVEGDVLSGLESILEDWKDHSIKDIKVVIDENEEVEVED